MMVSPAASCGYYTVFGRCPGRVARDDTDESGREVIMRIA